MLVRLTLAAAFAVAALPGTAAHAEPTCPPGWQDVRLTVPGTNINRLIACLPPA